jgi:hypothetical protein
MSALASWPPFIFYLGLLLLIGYGTLAAGWAMDLVHRHTAAVRPASSAAASITSPASPATAG